MKRIQALTIWYILIFQNALAGIGYQKSGLHENSVAFYSRDVFQQMRKIQMTAKILKINRSLSTTFLDMHMTWLVASPL